MEKLIFEKSRQGRKGYSLPKMDVPEVALSDSLPKEMIRQQELALPEVSENEIARHFVRLSKLNFNIEEGIYPLGSCTMKYNPKVNEKTAGLPGFANVHPCSEIRNVQGALQVMYELGELLKQITNLQGVSLQPSAGSQGEFTGILMFRAYHKSRNDEKRKIILIPDSAHGTNPASAAIGGFKIMSVKSNANGRIDIEDLKSKCTDEVAGFMLTNPNTLGLFETNIVEIEKLVHGCGGLMYMDGANLNALLGITTPGLMKFDCVHINLHKTFSTPHGGGGPGSGPVCISERLLPFLPVPQVVKNGNNYDLIMESDTSVGSLHSYFGNFGVFVRALTYILMHGPEGLKDISKNAIINANYLFSQVKSYYEAPYEGPCMHEFIISGNIQKKENGVSTKDIGKRLLDYGFHAPTVYFPLIVSEAMLVEPTETETIENLDSLADSMIAIAKEAKEIPESVINSPLTTPVRRLDDALAARNLNISWYSSK